MQFWQGTRQGLVNDKQQSLVLEKLPILLNRQVTIVFVQRIMWVRCRFYVPRVVVDPAVDVTEEVIPLKKAC